MSAGLIGPVIAEARPGAVPAGLVLQDHDLRVVVVVPSPGVRSDAALGQEILIALGVRDGLKGNAWHQGHRNLGLAAVRLAANHTRWLVLASPGRVPAGLLETAAQTAAVGGASLMLLCDPGCAEPVRRRVAALGPVVVTQEEALRMLPPADPPDEVDDPFDGVTVDDLPALDFYAFRSAYLRSLPVDVAAAVDGVYVAAREAAWKACADTTVTPDTVDGLVRRLAGNGLARGLVVVRGVQAGAFRAGWHVRAEHGRLLEGLAAEDRAELTDERWRSLRAWRYPVHAAAVALHLADATVDDMCRLTVGDAASASAAPAGAPAWVDGVRVDPRGRAYVAAIYATRVRDGAADDDTLLPVPTVASVSKLLREARTELDLPVAERKAPTGSSRRRRAVSRLGLSVACLAPDRAAG